MNILYSGSTRQAAITETLKQERIMIITQKTLIKTNNEYSFITTSIDEVATALFIKGSQSTDINSPPFKKRLIEITPFLDFFNENLKKTKWEYKQDNVSIKRDYREIYIYAGGNKRELFDVSDFLKLLSLEGRAD
jgi:hypothetical protein